MDMDLGVGLVQTPDSEAETPPRNPPTKRVHHTARVSYKECMKNHAASIGGHALDGCCEFMPGPSFNPADPTSLKCGACGCHRNFHRRDPDDPTPLNHHPITAGRRAHSPPTASQLLLSLSQSPSGPSDEVNVNSGACGGGGVLVGYSGGQNGNFLGSGSSKKRFRTKFSQEQKEKMYEFSEKIGWKLRKGEERLIEEFVKEIGVERSVFKVWMHNNKHTSSTCTTTPTPKLQNDVKIQEHHPHIVSATTTAVNFEQQLVHQQQQQHNSSNGSKSSSSNNNNNNNNNNNVGNCGASVFDNHNHSHHHHRCQFSFANGGGQEAAQAQ